MPAPEIIKKLIDTFETHSDHYKSSKYNETQLRREFLDPFCKALGWDIDNEQGYADAYKDVIHEDAIKIGGITKAPDYCFRIGGTRKFFLEAKKPSVSIKSDSKPAYELRRYAWSAKLPLSVLSDFEEFAIYDTRIRPHLDDKPSKARTFFCTYDQYADKWDEIASIFSREAILKGSFDKYADTSKKKRGTAEVDDAFLEEIERWRDLLARNFALRNSQLSVRDLNYAVQKTIDRLIFLRICEDRGTEDYGRLNILQNGKDIWLRLNELFRNADDRYNSGLFHFRDEKGRGDSPDRLTPQLILDDKVLKDIIKHLYYPDSPYEFSVLPADILGQVYEQFLGKTIRLTDSHQARIEQKPEVRKAGGVYYTPTYIVDYIIANTLGRLLNGDQLENKKPIPVAQAAKLKVCDPACGSGSFLIVAYQFLLDWHRDQYTLDPETAELDKGKVKRHSGGKNPKIYQAKGGGWKLTTPERKRILLNNIYGVDIDNQAVEVTKLSLLLKVLEGETQQQLQRDFISERQRILPDLGDNIQCGNSLIGPDFYENEQMQMLDDETKYRVNVFDWESAFPEVFKQDGFDCVVGNPPWIDIKGLPKIETEYFSKSYDSTANRMNVYAVFMEKGFSLLRTKGLFGFITPSSFLTQSSYQKLRALILQHSVTSIVRLPDNVFEGVVAESVVLTLEHTANSGETIVAVYDRKDSLSEIQFSEAKVYRILDSDFWKSLPAQIFNLHILPHELALCDEVEAKSILLEEIMEFCLGLTPYDKYQGQSPELISRRGYHSTSKETEFHKPLLSGADINRYLVSWSGKEYIKYGSWLGAPRQPKFFSEPRIIIRQIISGNPLRIYAGYTSEELYNTQVGFSLLLKGDSRISILFILGVLNSRFITWYHRCRFLDLEKNTFQKILIQDARKLPIRPIDFDKPDDVARHDKIVSLVERMLDLHKQKAEEGNPNTLKQLETQITATDRQIDRLVYELYELTDEEISLVKQSASSK